jgi:replicative DNA helicase
VIDSLDEQKGGNGTDLRKPRRKKSAPTMPADLSKIDRLPPHSLEAEQGVLGCVLLSPNDCLGECIEKLKGGADVFYDLRHRTIYEMLTDMYERKDAIDLITVQQACSKESGASPTWPPCRMPCRPPRTSNTTSRSSGRNSCSGA